jgi:hypothetical protein
METSWMKRRFPRMYSLAFVVAGVLSVVMLLTDKNLQNNFGTVSSGYFVHWYAVLGMAIVDFAGAGLLLGVGTRRMAQIGVIGSALFALAMVADIATWSLVGFSSPTSFADYLFGVTYFGGDIRYLFDALLGVYLGTSVVGAVGLRLSRDVSLPAPAGAPAGSSSN